MLLDRIPVRLRLSLGHALWMALLFLSVGYGLHQVVETSLFRSVDASLLFSAQAIREARFRRGFNPPLMEQFLNEFFGERYIRSYAQLVDLSGKISAKTDLNISLPVTPHALNRAEHGLETYEAIPSRHKGAPGLRMITLPVLKGGRFTGELIQVGAPLDAFFLTMREIRWVLWTSLPAGFVLSILFGYMLTKRSLKPVTNISIAATNLRSEDLSLRLPLPKADDELRRLTATFNGMLEHLDDAFKRLRRFTGDVSHELRTPLAVLRGEAELALRRERTPEQYRASLTAIAAEATSMTNIIEELLLLARAESKAVAMHWLDLSMPDFVRDLTVMVEPVFQQKRVHLTVVRDGPHRFFANPGYLSLALKNLLINAAKHSAADGLVMLRVEQVGNDVVFIVKDQGEGITADAIPYIFDAFYRADTARNRAAGGTGIGLSLAMALVKLHGGTITVQSSPGAGAEFKVQIPRPTAEQVDAGKKYQSPAEARLSSARNKQSSPVGGPKRLATTSPG